MMPSVVRPVMRSTSSADAVSVVEVLEPVSCRQCPAPNPRAKDEKKGTRMLGEDGDHGNSALSTMKHIVGTHCRRRYRPPFGAARALHRVCD